MLSLLINVIRIVAPVAGVVCFFLDLPIVVYIAGGVDVALAVIGYIFSRKASRLVYFVLLFGLPFIVSLIFETPWLLSVCFTTCFLSTLVLAFGLLFGLFALIAKIADRNA